jgi:hypothetical protein
MVLVCSGKSLMVEMKLWVEYAGNFFGLFSYCQLLQNYSTTKN